MEKKDKKYQVYRQRARRTCSFFFAALLIICLFKKIGDPAGEIHLFGYQWDRADSNMRIFEAAVGMVLSYSLPILELLFSFRFSFLFELFFLIFLVSALCLGSMFDFYWYFGSYDLLMHGTSSALLAILAYSLWEDDLEKRGLKKTGEAVSQPWIGYFSGVSFACLASVVWELMEYIFDGVVSNQNAQHAKTQEGAPLLGHAALTDTMGDMAAHLIGGMAGIALIHASQKKGKSRPFDLQLRVSWQDSRSRRSREKRSGS